MPAKDKHHDTVIKALQKDDWTILKEQYPIYTQSRTLWIDLLVSHHSNNSALLIEVKSFASGSFVEDLANAIGKYILYSAILNENHVDTKLYLAIPKSSYETMLDEDIGRILLKKFDLSLVVFNPLSEEVVNWIN